MRIEQHDWGVIVGETDGIAKEAIDALSKDAATHRGIYLGAQLGCCGQIAYDANWWVNPKHGLGFKPVFESRCTHEKDFQAIPVPFNLPLFIGNETWEHLGGWPELPDGDAYGLVALGLKAYFMGFKKGVTVPVRCSTVYAFKPQKPATPSMLNAHFVHAAYFSDDVYQHVWRRMLLRLGYTTEVDAVLELDTLKREQGLLDSRRAVVEELFFRKALFRRLENALIIDEETMTAKPRSFAHYVGYEARRSPGREWRMDKHRITGHINSLLSYMRDNKIDPASVELLDIGSRDGWALDQLAEKGFSKDKIQGIEISIWSGQYGRSLGRRLSWGDAHDLSRWKDNTFDIVTSWHSLEHCHTPFQVLKEFRRVLKPTGVLMIIVPTHEKQLSVKGDHCHEFRNGQHVIQIVGKAGFICVDFLDLSRQFVGFFRGETKFQA